MCDLKPGDEVVCVRSKFGVNTGKTFTIAAVCPVGETPDGFSIPIAPSGTDLVQLNEMAWHQGVRRGCWFWGYDATAFRKVQRRDLTAWLATEKTIEEPKRAPAKKRERVE